MEELWKDIPGYEGKYQVSNTGKIKSFSKGRTEGIILKPHIARGYSFISLSNNNKRKNLLLHRLVAAAFIDNPNNYPEVNHKDENKQNNSANNLEWCTRDYNMAYKSARTRQGITYGTPVEQLTIDDIPIAKYCDAEIASKLTGFDSSSIHKCCRNERKHAGGYKWRYVQEF